MKKKVIVFSALLIGMLIVMTGILFCKPKYEHTVEFEEIFVVENGVAPEKTEHVIVLQEDGDYVMHGDWSIDPMGMVLGIDIADENGKVLRCFIAGTIDWNTDVMELPAGKYTMTLTPIANEKQWREYCAQFDTSDWAISVEEAESGAMFADGRYSLDFAFGLEKSEGLPGLVVVLGAVLGVLIFVIVFAAAQKDGGMKQNYDERQEVSRGRGAKYGLYTMFFFNMALFLAEVAGIRLPMSPGMALLISVLVGGIVFAVYCVWKEAYFALNQKAGVYIGLFFVLAVYNLGIGIKVFLAGEAFYNHQLTIQSINLFVGVMMSVLCGTLMIKKACKDREEE